MEGRASARPGRAEARPSENYADPKPAVATALFFDDKHESESRCYRTSYG